MTTVEDGWYIHLQEELTFPAVITCTELSPYCGIMLSRHHCTQKESGACKKGLCNVENKHKMSVRQKSSIADLPVAHFLPLTGSKLIQNYSKRLSLVLFFPSSILLRSVCIHSKCYFRDTKNHTVTSFLNDKRYISFLYIIYITSVV
jgi:hypothetical protein